MAKLEFVENRKQPTYLCAICYKEHTHDYICSAAAQWHNIGNAVLVTYTDGQWTNWTVPASDNGGR